MEIREREGRIAVDRPKNGFAGWQLKTGKGHLYRNGACIPQG